jgi:hypothetical protein
MKIEHKELYKQIDEILWQDWDPIGINDEEKIRDEYYGYIPQVFSLKIQGADKNKIAEYLYEMETINIGTYGNKQNCEFVAQKIINL